MKQRKSRWLFTIALVIGAAFCTSVVADEQREKIFTNLYATGAWGTNEEGLGSSGPESTIENSRNYVEFLQNFMITNGIQSVVDVGCGDWSFSKAINWGNVSYTGVDIVRSVTERNQKLFSSPNVTFVHGDINEIELPTADLLVCKDVLQYLSNNDVHQFLQRINQFKYCLITNDLPLNTSSSRTITSGDHRPLDLTKPPFNIQGAKMFTYLAGNSIKQILLKINTNAFQSPTAKKKYFVMNNIHSYQGFFSLFHAVLSYLDLYDKHEIDGLIVDFKSNGLYYEPAYGLNWWSYYFKPIELGTGQEVQDAEIDYSEAQETGRVAYLAEIGLSRERVSELIKKYVEVKPEILKEVDQIVAEKFGNKFVIGIHYRGTDHQNTEASSIAYENLSAAINHYVNENQIKDYSIFVASDEEPFLEYMENKFEGKIISQNCLRSSDNQPVHYFNPKNDSPYKLGREALTDCLLLSKCKYLIRTSSCLSLVSTYFNPELTDTVLNERITHLYRRF